MSQTTRPDDRAYPAYITLDVDPGLTKLEYMATAIFAGFHASTDEGGFDIDEGAEYSAKAALALIRALNGLPE